MPFSLFSQRNRFPLSIVHYVLCDDQCILRFVSCFVILLQLFFINIPYTAPEDFDECLCLSAINVTTLNIRAKGSHNLKKKKLS